MSFSVMRKIVAGLCAAASLLGTAAAQPGDRVSGPVRLLVGFPPGGGGDIVARTVADRLSRSIGATVIVENRAGAGGRLAAEILKNAPADGNTVLITPLAPIVIAPLTFRKLNYNPEADFVPVAQLVKFPLAIATGANSPFKTLDNLVAWLKANPAQASFGTSAAGSQLHFLGLMFAQAIKVDMTHVPYQGGAPLVTDLIGGQIPVGVDQFPYEFHKAGKIRMLATSGAARSPLMPDVPTFKEQGYPGVEGEAWFGAYMHVKTPAPIVQRIGEALVDAVRQPDAKQQLAQSGLEATGLAAPEFAALVAADRARWKPVIEASGFRGD